VQLQRLGAKLSQLPWFLYHLNCLDACFLVTAIVYYLYFNFFLVLFNYLRNLPSLTVEVVYLIPYFESTPVPLGDSFWFINRWCLVMEDSLRINWPFISMEFHFYHKEVFFFNHEIICLLVILIRRAQADPLDSLSILETHRFLFVRVCKLAGLNWISHPQACVFSRDIIEWLAYFKVDFVYFHCGGDEDLPGAVLNRTAFSIREHTGNPWWV
jgi:hypothetical protein